MGGSSADSSEVLGLWDLLAREREMGMGAEVTRTSSTLFQTRGAGRVLWERVQRNRVSGL